MTLNQLRIILTCNGKELAIGANEECDFTSEPTGLESSELKLSTSDNVLLDGENVDGKKIGARHIHIEASFKSAENNALNRQMLIKFFNPKYTGKMLIEYMGTSRNIMYELEGWNFIGRKNLDMALGFVVDFKCPDPYMQNVDNFGKNMANITPLTAFPWRVTTTRLSNKHSYPAEYRGLLLGSSTTGYRTLRKEVVLVNDGDVPTGVQIEFVATRGPVVNPMITNADTGEFMRVVLNMAKGDVLLVDTNENHQVITLNGVNVYQKVDRGSEPFSLKVGDNYLVYDADRDYTNLDVNLYYIPKYLGV